ncbi:MAG: VOC family protein [Jatrophihabitantaceae bacterium]
MTANSLQAVLLTANLDRLVSFYSGLLDAEQYDRVPEAGDAFFVGLRVGDSKLGIAVDPNAVSAGNAQRILLSVEVQDVEAMLERVSAAGGTVTGGPNDMPWGQRVVHLADPDGNTVNLTQQL